MLSLRIFVAIFAQQSVPGKEIPRLDAASRAMSLANPLAIDVLALLLPGQQISVVQQMLCSILHTLVVREQFE